MREPTRSRRSVPGRERQAHHHLLRNGSLLEPLVSAIFRGARTNLLGGRAQGELAQHVQISFAKEVGQRLLNFFRRVNLSLSQPRSQLVNGYVDVHDFIGALEKAVRNGLADLHVGRAGHGVVQRFKVLNVECRKHVDARVEQFEHVFVALAVARPGTLVCASSSTITMCGLRARMASISISFSTTER